MVWIIGEYAERIDNADELLDTFLETFEEEDPAVQLQLLTATVKCFLKNPKISLGKPTFSFKDIAKPKEIQFFIEKSKYFLRKTGFFFDYPSKEP